MTSLTPRADQLEFVSKLLTAFQQGRNPFGMKPGGVGKSSVDIPLLVLALLEAGHTVAVVRTSITIADQNLTKFKEFTNSSIPAVKLGDGHKWNYKSNTRVVFAVAQTLARRPAEMNAITAAIIDEGDEARLENKIYGTIREHIPRYVGASGTGAPLIKNVPTPCWGDGPRWSSALPGDGVTSPISGIPSSYGGMPSSKGFAARQGTAAGSSSPFYDCLAAEYSPKFYIDAGLMVACRTIAPTGLQLQQIGLRPDASGEFRTNAKSPEGLKVLRAAVELGFEQTSPVSGFPSSPSGGKPSSKGLAGGRHPFIVHASGCKHAALVHDTLQRAGIPTALILGSTPLEERKDAVRQIESGEILGLITVRAIGRGFDLPCLRFSVCAFVSASPTRLFQALWRSARSFPGKTENLVIDIGRNVERLGSPDWSVGELIEFHRKKAEDRARREAERIAQEIEIEEEKEAKREAARQHMLRVKADEETRRRMNAWREAEASAERARLAELHAKITPAPRPLIRDLELPYGAGEGYNTLHACEIAVETFLSKSVMLFNRIYFRFLQRGWIRCISSPWQVGDRFTELIEELALDPTTADLPLQDQLATINGTLKHKPLLLKIERGDQYSRFYASDIMVTVDGEQTSERFPREAKIGKREVGDG